jgi:hypothetical protein
MINWDRVMERGRIRLLVAQAEAAREPGSKVKLYRPELRR